MINYSSNRIEYNHKPIDFKGLKENQIMWHISELNEPDEFIKNLSESYMIPKKINHISIVEGSEFDALLIDNKMFRYSKIDESCISDIQDYINKGAYATAILKLNQSSNIIGPGLNKVYSIEESYNYYSSSYDLLFENTYVTNESGRLVESFLNKINIYENEGTFSRGVNNKRYVEDWSNDFNKDLINTYSYVKSNEDNGMTNITFINNKGHILEAVYSGVNNKLVESGFNLKQALTDGVLHNSYRIGTMLEYVEPFTIKEAVIVSYDIDGNIVKLGMIDTYGNKGVVDLSLNISGEEFKNKYDKELNDILEIRTFSDRLIKTAAFFREASDDIKSISKIKGKQVSDDESMIDWGKISYKVKGLIPKEVIEDDKNAKDRFKIIAYEQGDESKLRNITFSYNGDYPINEFIDEANDMIDNMDVNSPTDVIDFYKEINASSTPLRSYPVGISTSSRNYHKGVTNESEQMSFDFPMSKDEKLFKQDYLSLQNKLLDDIKKFRNIVSEAKKYNDTLVKYKHGLDDTDDTKDIQPDEVLKTLYNQVSNYEVKYDDLKVAIKNFEEIFLNPIEDIDSFISDNKEDGTHYYYSILQQVDFNQKFYDTYDTDINDILTGTIYEEASVQVTDIAPQDDQDLGGGLITVNMKKRKKKKEESEVLDFKKDLLIDKIDEQDEYFGSKGFIKDSDGRYHFGDYYINESGKVVHKSKLNEGYFSPKPEDWDDINHWYNDDPREEWEKQDFERWKEENSDKIAAYYSQTYSKDLKNINQRIWDSIAKDIYDEEKMPEKINKMESQELADEAYYKVNDVALKLQEVKPYIKEGTEADKLYTNITIELNSLQMSLYKEKLNESTYRDKAGKDGIQSYFDMVYGQEPDSEYAKLILLYMKNHDEIRDDIEKIRSTYKDDTDNPEYRKAMQDIQNRDMDNTKLLSKAARIPEDERGKLYQEYLEIDKANNDEFAKQRGFNSYDEYEKHIFEAISNSKELYNAQEKLKRSEAWLKDNPDDKEVKQNIENIQNDIDDYKGIKRYSPNVEETSFKQGDEEFTVHTYNYGDDSFSISYKMHGKRNITNEPYTIDGEYNFIYDEENKEVLTGMKKDGKVVPDNWGKMTNVSKDRWLEMIHNPKDALIPWVQGSYLD